MTLFATAAAFIAIPFCDTASHASTAPYEAVIDKAALAAVVDVFKTLQNLK